MTTTIKTQTPDLLMSINKRGVATYQVNREEGINKLLHQLNYPTSFYSKSSYESGIVYTKQYDGWSSRSASNAMRIEKSGYGNGNHGWTRIQYGKTYTENRLNTMLASLKEYHIDRLKKNIRQQLFKKLIPSITKFSNSLSDISYTEFQYQNDLKDLMKPHIAIKTEISILELKKHNLYDKYQDALDKYCKKTGVIWYQTEESDRLKFMPYKKYRLCYDKINEVEKKYQALYNLAEKSLVDKHNNECYLHGFRLNSLNYGKENWTVDQYGYPLNLKTAYGKYKFSISRVSNENNQFHRINTNQIANVDLEFTFEKNKIKMYRDTFVINPCREHSRNKIESINFTVKDMVQCSNTDFIDYVEQLRNKRNDLDSLKTEIQLSIFNTKETLSFDYKVS